MRNFVQAGEVLDLDPGATVAAGTGHLFGSVFGVAAVDAVSGTASSFVVEGVVAIAKTSALAISVGDLLYWDAANSVVNKTATAQQQVGIAIAAAANPSATVTMLLRGGPAADAADVGFANPMTTAGDLIGGGIAGAAARLANPGAGTFNLQSVDGVLTWTAAA